MHEEEEEEEEEEEILRTKDYNKKIQSTFKNIKEDKD